MGRSGCVGVTVSEQLIWSGLVGTVESEELRSELPNRRDRVGVA